MADRKMRAVLYLMADRKMRAVLYLNNFWEWSGGMAAYVAWANGERGVDPADTSRAWRDFVEYAASFYTNQRANALYRDHIRRIVTRRNTVNDRPYSEDPTIMSWQLANEPRPGMEGHGESNFRIFSSGSFTASFIPLWTPITCRLE
jgi:mannan endo-1,4-beta-mannosidase